MFVCLLPCAVCRVPIVCAVCVCGCEVGKWALAHTSAVMCKRGAHAGHCGTCVHLVRPWSVWKIFLTLSPACRVCRQHSG